MTSQEYRDAIEALGLSQLAAAPFLGISPRTSQGYALGEYPVPKAIAMLLDLLVSQKRETKGYQDPSSDATQTGS